MIHIADRHISFIVGCYLCKGMFFICFFMPPLHPLNETVSEYHGTPRHHQLCCQSQQQKNSIFGTPEAHVDWYLIFRYKKQQASHIVHPLAMESRESFSDTSSDWVHFNSISIHFSWCINTKCYGNRPHDPAGKKGLAIANLRLIASGMCLVSLPTLQNHKLW